MTFDTRPILVPLDGSNNAEHAIGPAMLLAQKLGAPVRFIHVADSDEIDGSVDLESARVTFAEYVRAYVQGLPGTPAATEVVVVTGSAPHEVLDASEAAQAVVLATHGRGGIKASLIGSVADKIVRGARVPTFVIPSGVEIAFGTGPVLVGLDGSEAAEQGLAPARELAGHFGTTVALVRAFNVPPPVGVEFVAYPVDMYDAMQVGAEAYLEEAAQPGEESYAILAPPVDALEDAAVKSGAGLVVLTSHGKNFARRIALGSVTDRATHTLKRAMLIIPVAG